MQDLTMMSLSGDVNSYIQSKPYLKKVFINRSSSKYVLYFFTDSIEKFPEDISALESELERKYRSVDFNVKVVPYEKDVVERYAESYGLIPMVG